MMKKILTASAVFAAVAAADVKFDLKDGKELTASAEGKLSFDNSLMDQNVVIYSDVAFSTVETKKVDSKDVETVTEHKAKEVHKLKGKQNITINKEFSKDTLVFLPTGEELKGDSTKAIATVGVIEDATTKVKTPTIMYTIDADSEICKKITAADAKTEELEKSDLKEFIADCKGISTTPHSKHAQIAKKRDQANTFTRYLFNGTLAPIVFVGDASAIKYEIAMEHVAYYTDKMFVAKVSGANLEVTNVMPFTSLTLAKSFESAPFEADKSFFARNWKIIVGVVSVVVIAGVVFVVFMKNKKAVTNDTEVDLIGEESA